MTFDQRIRLDDELTEEIRAYAAAHHIVSVAEAIRILITKGLIAEEGRS